MDAAKVADAVISQILVTNKALREIIIEEIGKEVGSEMIECATYHIDKRELQEVDKPCGCVRHWRHDKS